MKAPRSESFGTFPGDPQLSADPGARPQDAALPENLSATHLSHTCVHSLPSPETWVPYHRLIFIAKHTP